jgi:hypothetical protein
MALPHIWLAQENITDIQWGNIKKYFVIEGLDAV